MPKESLWFLDTRIEIHVDGEETGGTYAIVESLAPPGHMPPPHVHARESEGFLVLEGELTVHTEEGPAVLRAGEGVHAPAGRAHTIEVTSSTPARWVVVSQPAGFEDFVRAVAEPARAEGLPQDVAPPDPERLARVAAEHGVTLLGPPGTLPVDVAGTSA